MDKAIRSFVHPSLQLRIICPAQDPTERHSRFSMPSLHRTNPQQRRRHRRFPKPYLQQLRNIQILVARAKIYQAHELELNVGPSRQLIGELNKIKLVRHHDLQGLHQKAWRVAGSGIL
ncbi:hypothetical protein METBIDRAFT_29765, partial [Metschnikowia bicuspidata var. bicuspidata NRRL YB-4993]